MIRRLNNRIKISVLALLLWVVALITPGILFERMVVVRSAPQQESRWKEIVETVHTAMSRGREDEALNLIQPLLAQKERHDEVARVCVELGELLGAQGNRDAAERLFRKALEIRAALYGEESLAVAEASFVLGQLYLSRVIVLQAIGSNREASENLDQAEMLLNTALRVREHVLGPKAVGVSEVLQQLAITCLHRHGFNDRECPENLERRQRIAEIVTGNLPPTHPDWAKALYAVADGHERRGEFDQALVVKQIILEQMEKSFGHASPHVAQALRLLAETYRNERLWGQAVSALKEVVSIGARGDENTLALAADLRSLADAYTGANEFGQAKETFQRAMDIEKKQWGADSYARTSLLNDYATFLGKIGATEAAKSVKAEIERVTKKTEATNVRLFSELRAQTTEEAKRKLGVKVFEQGVPTEVGVSIRCRGQRVEQIQVRGEITVLREVGGAILSCDFDDESKTIMVATSGKVVLISSTGKLLEESQNEPGTISSAVWAGSGEKIISHDYSRYDMDDELVLIRNGKFVMVLGHVPSHSVLVRDRERVFALAPPDPKNISRVFEVILPQ